MAVKDQRRGARWMPLFYTSYYGELIDIARSHGYALALHGSVARDMDLILVPWVENPDPAEDVLKDFQMTVGDGCARDAVDWSTDSKGGPNIEIAQSGGRVNGKL